MSVKDDGGTALSTTEMKALVDWSVTPPFITANSGGPNSPLPPKQGSET